MKSQDNPIYSPVVIDMVTVSAEYCLFLEKLSLSGTTRRKFLEQITRLLPLIYVKASLLPRLDDSGYFDLPITVSEDDYEEVRQMVWRLLKGDDEYLEVFTPDMQYSEGAMTHTISEDLADIYQDLKNFVAVFADRRGQCLVNVMRPLHDLLYTKAEDEEDADIADFS